MSQLPQRWAGSRAALPTVLGTKGWQVPRAAGPAARDKGASRVSVGLTGLTGPPRSCSQCILFQL